MPHVVISSAIRRIGNSRSRHRLKIGAYARYSSGVERLPNEVGGQWFKSFFRAYLFIFILQVGFMQKNYTHISVVLDRSGSMRAIADDMIGGFNQFLAEQQKVPGKGTITLIRFDNEIDTVCDFINLLEAHPINQEILKPRGNTALLDAIGYGLAKTGERLASMAEDDKPNKVIFLIITDGQENASKEYTYKKISEQVSHQTEVYKWEFIFLGANQDAIFTANKLGIQAGNALTYAADDQGTTDALKDVSSNILTSRASTAGGQSVNTSFTSDQRKKQLR